jgi:mannose-6-phosphate isomerase-like protein (cupin superfamily)
MEYNIHTDIKYSPLEVVEAARLAADCPERWWNQSLCLVNDCVVRVGVFKGEFHWHKHDLEDEFFFVLEGELLLDLEERNVTLAPGQGMLVPRGVNHRTRADRRTVVLMIEAASVTPTGN